MTIRAISLLQRISLDVAASPRKCTPCMRLCMHVRAGLITFIFLFSLLTVLCYVTISVFSLDLWEGKVLCIRPSLAMHGHILGHTGIHTWGI